MTRAGPIQTAPVVCHHAQRPVALKFRVDHCQARFCCSSQLRIEGIGPETARLAAERMAQGSRQLPCSNSVRVMTRMKAFSSRACSAGLPVGSA